MQAATEQEYCEYVRARLPELRRIAYRLCGDEHRADDLVQQSITKLYLHWPRVRTVNNLDGYVRTILTNTFLSERRSPWARVTLFRRPPEPAPGGHAAVLDPATTNVEERDMLRGALSKVPLRQRTVLVLRFLCDLPVSEVASMLGCTDGTVKSQTAHGLQTLRRLLTVPTPVISKGMRRA